MLVESGQGVVVFIDADGNYGFIDPDDPSGDVVFKVHPGNEGLQLGDRVAYDLTPLPQVTQGGKLALRIRRLGFVASGAQEPMADEAAPPEG